MVVAFGGHYVEPMSRLKLAGVIEGTTLLLLVGLAVPLKYFLQNPIGLETLGPIHGLAFLAYSYLLFERYQSGLLDGRSALKLSAASFIPGGTFFAFRSVE